MDQIYLYTYVPIYRFTDLPISIPLHKNNRRLDTGRCFGNLHAVGADREMRATDPMSIRCRPTQQENAQAAVATIEPLRLIRLIQIGNIYPRRWCQQLGDDWTVQGKIILNNRLPVDSLVLRANLDAAATSCLLALIITRKFYHPTIFLG